MAVTDRVIAASLRDAVAARGPTKIVCPSEIARGLSSTDWRALMPRIRKVAAVLAGQGEIAWYQSGQPIEPDSARPWPRLRP